MATLGEPGRPLVVLFGLTAAQVSGSGIAAAGVSGLLISCAWGLAYWQTHPQPWPLAGQVEFAAFAGGLLTLPLLMWIIRGRPKPTAVSPSPETLAQLSAATEQNRHLKTAYRDLVAVHRDLRREAGQAKALISIYKAAVLLGDGRPDWRMITEAVTGTGKADAAVIWVVAPGESVLRVEACSPSVSNLCHGLSVPLGDSGRSGGRSMVKAIEGARDATDWKVALHKAGLRERRLVCKASDGSAAGAVSLLYSAENVFFERIPDEAFSSLADAVGTAIAAALQRARVSHRGRELSLLSHFSRLSQTARSAPEAAQEIVSVTASIIPDSSCSLYLLNEADGKLQVQGSTDTPVNLVADVVFSAGPGLVGWVMQENRALHLADLERDKFLPELNLAESGYKSLAALPLRFGDDVMGVLMVASRRRGVLGTDQFRLLELLAGQAATVLANLTRFRKLERLAITDAVTHAFNRHYLFFRLEEELRRAKRYGLPLSLLMVDIDHFKLVNDSLGHAAGDKVLRSMTQMMEKSLRETEIVCRYGGEEFLIILPQTRPQEAKVVAERMRQAIEKSVFTPTLGEEPVRITISCGIAAYPEQGENLEQLIAAADAALYAAKSQGRNRVSLTGAKKR
jgi:diguanylate cyclase (GGDEF)-like protein